MSKFHFIHVEANPESGSLEDADALVKSLGGKALLFKGPQTYAIKILNSLAPARSEDKPVGQLSSSHSLSCPQQDEGSSK
jgi:hypothetical protein